MRAALAAKDEECQNLRTTLGDVREERDRVVTDLMQKIDKKLDILDDDKMRDEKFFRKWSAKEKNTQDGDKRFIYKVLKYLFGNKLSYQTLTGGRLTAALHPDTLDYAYEQLKLRVQTICTDPEERNLRLDMETFRGYVKKLTRSQYTTTKKNNP